MVKGKAKIVADIKKASKEADRVFIGSDPDREGEAIAFHVAEEIAKGKGAPVQRVLFNEITEKSGAGGDKIAAETRRVEVRRPKGAGEYSTGSSATR